ncbi:MAG: iron-containing redox enzyme family protein [Acidimicrobiales bacterium]|nr:iron-containing redox enzyme family protein [Acidimicrobiales bacterium]
MPVLPRPRGPLSGFVSDVLVGPPSAVPAPPRAADDPLSGDDSQLALYMLYELHYRGFDGVHPEWEWEPTLLDVRRRLEQAFARRLAEDVPRSGCADVEGELHRIVGSGGDGPSLSRYLLEHGTMEQLREFTVHRSAYQLKEADPHTWAIPRLVGRPKAAMVAIQTGEYGDGVACAMHSSLFAETMGALGLDDTYGAYLDLLPGSTLATVNLISMFGLHRRWRGALVGHLALFEMTSVMPMGRYSETLRRLGLPERARRFYDVHVAADVEHQAIAATELAGGLAADEPDLALDICFGAQAAEEVERRFARHLLASWTEGRSSLLPWA